MDLVERIDAWSRLTPDRAAHVCPGSHRQLTYAELKRGSDALAAYIQHTLGDDRSPVVVMGHKQPEMLLGFLGSVKAGRAYRRFLDDWRRSRGRAELLRDLDGAVHRVFTGMLYKFILAELIRRYWLDPAATPPGLAGTPYT